jgi:hypothetical protein
MLSGLATYTVLMLLTLLVPTDAVWLITLSVLGAALYAAILHFASRGRDVRDFLGLIGRSFGHRQGI